METIRHLIANPLFDQVQSLLGEGDLRLNKELLLLARHMGLARGFGNFRDLTQYATDRLFNLPYFRHGNSRYLQAASNYVDPGVKLEEFFNNPLYSGGIIMSSFLAPLSSRQEEEIRLEAAMKEIDIMSSDAYHEDLDFSPFFGHYDNSLAPTVSPNPRMAKAVHTAIDTWIAGRESDLHYPTMSKKLLPSFTRRELDHYTSILMEDPSVATHATVEYLDVVKGISLEGPCEMSQRWYPNQQKPRTYFVSGATAYHRSKFMKEFWNSLCDSLMATERHNRVNPSRLHYDGVKQSVFYDLTSFTSNMAVQRRFLDVLGLYCTGKKIAVMDGRHGTTLVDMGELILEYNTLNWMPEYTTDLFRSYSGNIFHHGVGGFLGVFGNIATCTFLHGAFLLQLVTHEDECSCAGDDAIAFVEDEQTIWACVPLIGILAPEKSFSLKDLDVVYLKRRTWMDYREFRLRQRHYLQLPSMLRFCPSNVLRRFRESSYSRQQILELSASSLGATYRSMARIFSQQSAFEDGVLFITKYYDLMGFPHQGNVPQFTNAVSGPKSKLIPALDTLGSHDYIALTIVSLYSGQVTVPVREDYGDTQILLKKGTRFTGRSSQYLKYLLRLGYIEEVESVKTTYYGEEGLSKILEEFDPDVKLQPAKTIYRIVSDVPSYMFGGEQLILGSYDFDYSYMLGNTISSDPASDSEYEDSPPLDIDYDEDMF